MTGWEIASTAGSSESNDDAAVDRELGGQRGGRLLVVADGVGTPGAAGTIAEAAARRCAAHVEKHGADPGKALSEAIGAAKEAHPNHENTAAAILAVAVNEEGVWWAGAGNVALWHWCRQGSALRALGRVHDHDLSHKTPGDALTGMPAGTPDAGRETDVAAGDLVIAATSGARTLNERQLGEVAAAAAHKGESVADAIVEAVLEAGEAAQNNCTAAVLEIAREARRGRPAARTMIAGDRARGAVTVGGHELKLPAEFAAKGRKVRFAWGYSGTGPKALALAILASAAGNTAAREHHESFMRERVARLPGREWTMPLDEVTAWVESRTTAAADGGAGAGRGEAEDGR